MMQNTTNQPGVPSGHKLTEVQRFWLQHYQACQASGKTQVDYAHEHGLAVKSLYYWKKRLRHIGAIDTDLLSAPPVFHKEQITSASFTGIQCQIQFANGLACELTGLDRHGQVSGCPAILSAERHAAAHRHRYRPRRPGRLGDSLRRTDSAPDQFDAGAAVAV
jgi:hypothetical protein